MAYQDLLQTLAELSIALVGFTGIVAAIGRRSEGEWDPAERARLRSLLEAGVEGAVFAIAPLVVASAGVAEALIWRTGNGALALLHLAGAARFMLAEGIGPGRWFPGAGRAATLLMSTVAAALILGQVTAALGVLPGLGPFLYLGTLLWFLLVGLLQFIFLLIGTRSA